MPKSDFLIVYSDTVLGAPWDELIDRARESCEAEGARLVAFDSFAAFSGLEGEEENHAAVVTTKLKALRRLNAAGIAVVVVHHDKKSGGEGVNRVRGSGAFAAVCDLLVRVSRVEGNRQRTRRVTCLGHFPDVPETTDLRLTEAWRYELACEPPEAVRRALADGLCKTVEGIVRDTGLDRATAHRALQALERDGGVRVDGGGVKGDPHRYRLKKKKGASGDRR